MGSREGDLRKSHWVWENRLVLMALDSREHLLSNKCHVHTYLIEYSQHPCDMDPVITLSLQLAAMPKRSLKRLKKAL